MDCREITIEELGLIIAAGCNVENLVVMSGNLYIDAEEHDGLDY